MFLVVRTEDSLGIVIYSVFCLLCKLELYFSSFPSAMISTHLTLCAGKQTLQPRENAITQDSVIKLIELKLFCHKHYNARMCYRSRFVWVRKFFIKHSPNEGPDPGRSFDTHLEFHQFSL